MSWSRCGTRLRETDGLCQIEGGRKQNENSLSIVGVFKDRNDEGDDVLNTSPKKSAASDEAAVFGVNTPLVIVFLKTKKKGTKGNPKITQKALERRL